MYRIYTCFIIGLVPFIFAFTNDDDQDYCSSLENPLGSGQRCLIQVQPSLQNDLLMGSNDSDYSTHCESQCKTLSNIASSSRTASEQSCETFCIGKCPCLKSWTERCALDSCAACPDCYSVSADEVPTPQRAAPALPVVMCDSPPGQNSQCTHLRSDKTALTLGECETLMRYFDGDTFNYRPNECYIKKCGSADLKYSSKWGEYDVYSTFCETPQGAAPALPVVKCDSPPGQHAGCSHLRSDKTGLTLGECENLMRTFGGDTFNYRPNECYIKKCGSEDLKYSSKWGEYDVYSTYCETTPPHSPTPTQLAINGCAGDMTFWTCSVGDPNEPNSYGQVCKSSGGPWLGSGGQEHCMNACARGQTGQNNDCQNGNCMCVAKMPDGALKPVFPPKMPIWKCSSGRACTDSWCATNALQAGGHDRIAHVKAAGCYNFNDGALGKWTASNNDLCGGDPTLWTEYLKNNRKQAEAGGFIDKDPNKDCNMD